MHNIIFCKSTNLHLIFFKHITINLLRHYTYSSTTLSVFSKSLTTTFWHTSKATSTIFISITIALIYTTRIERSTTVFVILSIRTTFTSAYFNERSMSWLSYHTNKIANQDVMNNEQQLYLHQHLPFRLQMIHRETKYARIESSYHPDVIRLLPKH